MVPSIVIVVHFVSSRLVLGLVCVVPWSISPCRIPILVMIEHVATSLFHLGRTELCRILELDYGPLEEEAEESRISGREVMVSIINR